MYRHTLINQLFDNVQLRTFNRKMQSGATGSVLHNDNNYIVDFEHSQFIKVKWQSYHHPSIQHTFKLLWTSHKCFLNRNPRSTLYCHYREGETHTCILGLAPLSRRYSTTSRCPRYEATIRHVFEWMLAVSISAPFSIRNLQYMNLLNQPCPRFHWIWFHYRTTELIYLALKMCWNCLGHDKNTWWDSVLKNETYCTILRFPQKQAALRGLEFVLVQRLISASWSKRRLTKSKLDIAAAHHSGVAPEKHSHICNCVITFSISTLIRAHLQPCSYQKLGCQCDIYHLGWSKTL